MSRAGQLSRMHSRGVDFRPHRINRNPLRRVVGREGFREVLECGHTIHPPRDFIGETNAVRRRCWRCAALNAKEASTDE